MGAEGGRGDRLFVAVELPDDLKAALGRVRDEYPELRRELRWVRSEGVHVTLRFLGEASAGQRAELVRALDTVTAPAPFTLECRGLGIFGSPARPRVLWAGVCGDVSRLAELQREVEAACVRLGWPAEESTYRPHVTLARGRGRTLAARASLESLLAERRDSLFSRFEVRSVTLYASRLGPGGSVYTPLHRRFFAE
jgi:2'-5' RNA ligase